MRVSMQQKLRKYLARCEITRENILYIYINIKNYTLTSR